MNEKQLCVIKWYLVGFITFTIWTMLIWQYFHLGVPSHYFLQRADMPEISNGWGGILLPFFTWLAMIRIENRILKAPAEQNSLICKQVVFSFFIAFGYGVILSLMFIKGYSDISAVLFPAILVFALFFKVYQAQYVLGFILSMSSTFGAVLSSVFAAVIALASVVIYFFMHFAIAQIKKAFFN
jgi:hypothetical protein